MPAPLFSAADYLSALQALLPRGRAWPRQPDAILTALLSGFARSFNRSNASANDLLVQSFPATADEMLPDWEATLGLPAAYGVAPSTLGGRQAAVVAALTDTGGQSAAYFVALAATLGFSISIDYPFAPYRVTRPVNAPIASDEWAHVWRVNASAAIASTYTPAVDIVQATANFGNPLLEYVLALYKPAQTIAITSYT